VAAACTAGPAGRLPAPEPLYPRLDPRWSISRRSASIAINGTSISPARLRLRYGHH